MSDKDFIKMMRAVVIIGDGREPHIKIYKRLLKIIDKGSK